jgi:hypothetical protein
MRCPVCDDLHREYRSACTAEAAETLRVRDEMTRRSGHGGAGPDAPRLRWEAILTSKTDQLKIAFRLVQHRSSAHSA